MKEGSLIEIKTKDEKIKGTVMPSKDKNTLILKLASGYNIGIKKTKIKSTKTLKSLKPEEISLKKIKPKKSLKTIMILHTGGTIASSVDYETGGVVSKFTPEELVNMYPELNKIANIKSRLVKNMWSQDMRFVHYNLLAKEIKKEIKKVDGFIITQGTDTLHYTSAALAFILEDLNLPVILVGAQRSSDRGSSDAALNLLNAAYFITNSNFAEVAICMHENMNDDYCSILPACKSRKLHTSRRDAFKAVNTRPWARVNYKKKKIEYLKEDYKKGEKTTLNLKLFKNVKVGILKQHTNMYANQILFYKNWDGLIIESTGLGCMPISKKDKDTNESHKILKAIETLIKKGVVVAEAPQTIFGRLNLNVYEDQRKAQEIGVLGHLNDMTPETSFIKLAWLLSNYPKEKVKELFSENLRGEFNQRIGEEFF